MTVEFDATLNPNASTGIITSQWIATPDMSNEEFKNMVREMFEAADENKNQLLTIDEFKQFTLFVLEAIQGVNFSEEVTIENQFNKFDENKDGVLDWDEVWKMMSHLEEAMHAKEYSWIMTPTMGIEKFREMVKQIFQVSDADKSGVLSLD